MCRRRLNVLRAEPGFITHGHLYGAPAFLVDLAAGEGHDVYTYHEMADRARRSRAARVHITAAPLGSLDAVDLAHYLANHCQATVTIAFHAGEMLAADPLVYDSVLLVSPGVFYAADELDRRAGSVCVQHWPGERALQVLAEHCDSPFGLFLVLPPKDFGEAKVWLAQSMDARWHLLPAHDYTRLEDAELATMGVPSGKAR